MNLRDLIKLDEKYKKNILTFLSDDERIRSFRSMGLNQTLKNITAYMIYATNKSYDEIEKCLLTKQWIKDEWWRLPTPEELELLMLTNETYFEWDDSLYISNEISSDGIWVSCVWKDWNGKIFKERKCLTYRGSNYKSLYTVLVTEKEF